MLKQLRTLDLSRGMMTDAGAATLVEHRAAFAQLDVLDVSDNYLSEKAIRSLGKLARRVVAKPQKDDEGDLDMRWVSVGE